MDVKEIKLYFFKLQKIEQTYYRTKNIDFVRKINSIVMQEQIIKK